jgi:hypothetical protein
MVGESVRGPILAQGTEIVSEAAIFLQHENDVIDGLQGSAEVGSRGGRRID